MYCAYCGNALMDNYKFCPNCGAKVLTCCEDMSDDSDDYAVIKKNNSIINTQKYTVVAHRGGLIMGQKEFDSLTEAKIECDFYRRMYPDIDCDIDILPEGQPWLGRSFLGL